MSAITRLVKRIVNRLGIDIARLHNSPSYTLCGITNLDVSTVIDIGANSGQFARYISTIFPKAKLYCYEPLPSPFSVLYDWALGQQGRVKVFNIALGEKESEADMYYHIEHSPSSSFLSSTTACETLYPFTKAQKTITVQISTLDEQLINVSLQGSILVKMDVQGYEDRVIRGGRAILSKASACILEINLDELYKG